MIYLNNLDKVLVYSYGSVGSTSLHKAMELMHKNAVHTHIDEPIKQIKKNEKVLLISLTRNLFDKNISRFFQQFYKYTPYRAAGENLHQVMQWAKSHLRQNYNIDAQISTIKWHYLDKEDDQHKQHYIQLAEDGKSTQDQQELRKHFSIFNKIHNKKLANWFDNLNSVLNTNVFDKPFDFKEKYSIHTAGNVTILTLRFEDIQYWQSVFDKIFIQSPILEEKNRSSEKWYSDMYRQFKKDYKYSKDDIDLMSNMDWMQFYYKKDELDSIIKKYK
ncbi:hypothetical protein CMI37_10030 [Candidatus Pacearchaeota archaeon]|nr:hypothetical protein [Candidatus Pacearchaeota archaeon]